MSGMTGTVSYVLLSLFHHSNLTTNVCIRVAALPVVASKFTLYTYYQLVFKFWR